ncbi:fimbria/pilus outer membrane usher protein [Pantoea sp. SS70]|uniref:fimbria/pilus outer membrane usher protein n=1 Tax=Pantoea sp. SS70 TaxID=3024247 RepID=UPI002452DED0|nr:fimbria/pilus outer membrane usher protein [Pantoea sp. SS70]WGK60083.1 fimbrial biogenesis outer membrane usher protein [Pantoea sp. SS70]
MGNAFAAEYFNPELLSLPSERSKSAKIADLSHFEAGGQAPGEYKVALYLNNQLVDEREINFQSDDDITLLPQLTRDQYEQLGVRVGAIEGLKDLPGEAVISNLKEYIPSASADFRFNEMRLELSIPQMLVKQRVKGYVDPASWNQGLTAALLNYSVTGNQTRSLSNRSQGTNNALYANLRGGLNLGPWRLRSYGTYQQRSDSRQGGSSSFDVISTYLQRDIHAIKGQLTLGDSATPADVFDSVQFQGGQLVSDDSMLPDSLRGFAPVIRGVSETGAEVTIRQNGSVIYQSYVPPGPFEINDLYPASLSGDLVVTVKENDGSERTFSQPYSSIAIMQREGQLKYAMTIGKLRNSGGAISTGEAKFVQGTLIYGLPNANTVYGGMQLAKEYLSASAGIGLGIGRLGAISADITQSSTTLPNGEKNQGQSYRLRYSRSIVETGTSVSLAAYRYSTEGYYTLQDAMTNPADAMNGALNRNYRPRGEFQIMLNQSLGDAGSMYVSGSQRDYWNKPGNLRTYTLGYNTNVFGVSYGLNLSQSQDSDSGKEDRRLALTASVPLSRWLAGDSRNSMQLNYGMAHAKGQGTTHQAGLSGTALDNQLNYNVSQTLGDDNNTSNLSASYRGNSGTVSAGYNRSQSQEQINYGLRGGIVAHPYGVTLSQEMSDTVALVRAPGAANIKVNNQTGLSTDWRGYAVMPYMTPYRRTDISLDPQGLGTNVALDQTSTSVTPTRGAVVLADFKTQRGHQVMMTLRKANGDYVPFGATAKLLLNEGEQNNGSIVGDEGLLYISGMPDSGSLEVQWGRGADALCKVNFNLKSASENQMDGVPLQVQSVCQNSEDV